MLSDGMGMAVEGMIKETDTDRPQRIPLLGSLWGFRKLFRRTQLVHERAAIIIAIVPHVVHHCLPLDTNYQLKRATPPLLQGPLEQVPRP